MRPLRISRIRGGLVVCLALLSAAPAAAQVGGPPTPPVTLWQFLGIPQGIRKVRGATSNRRGNHPNREPKPSMKALADPANLESKDPSIKKAAEIKQAEDLKKQKIKAVKYLASIGCGCYDIDGGVTDALIASMSDCTEDVRYETIKAISEAAQTGCCANCGSTCCCNQKILLALARVAYERDDHGCYVEPSARVREAAVEALRICCPNDSPPIIVPKEEEKKPERETAEEIEEGESRETLPEDSDTPAPPTPPEALPGVAPADAEPLPGSSDVSYIRADASADPAVVGSAMGSAFGVVVDVSAQHQLALIQFGQSDVVAEVGSLVGVFQQIGDQRELVAEFEVVRAFPGSATITGAPEELARIVRGDMAVRAQETPAAMPTAPETLNDYVEVEVYDDISNHVPMAASFPAAPPAAAAARQTAATMPTQMDVVSMARVPSDVVEVTDAPVQQASAPLPATPIQVRLRRPVSANFVR